MTTDHVIAAVADEFADFSLADAGDTEQSEAWESYCPYAVKFQQWTNNLLDRHVRLNPDMISLAQAKVLLIDRFFEWRVSVPKSHRNRIGENGHVCIFQVFEQAYQQIKLAELSVTPPLLFIPAPPPPPPQIVGVPFGIKSR